MELWKISTDKLIDWSQMLQVDILTLVQLETVADGHRPNPFGKKEKQNILWKIAHRRSRRFPFLGKPTECKCASIFRRDLNDGKKGEVVSAASEVGQVCTKIACGKVRMNNWGVCAGRSLAGRQPGGGPQSNPAQDLWKFVTVFDNLTILLPSSFLCVTTKKG